MELPSKNLNESARWLISLRWAACVCVFVVVWLAAHVFGVLENPLPLYAIGLAMILYNLVLHFDAARGKPENPDAAVRRIVIQIGLDLAAMTLLLYFSDITRNPFIFFFVFHMIIGSILLPGRIPYLIAMLASVMVGSVFLLEYFGLIPVHPLSYGGAAPPLPPDGSYLSGLFAAFSSTLAITVYFTTSIQRYVRRARDEIRQKEKIIGIGQLVAGFAHQISNPLDGLQNCLESISASPHVGEDPKLAEYVGMMRNALSRIERIARRLQEFARPHGLKLSEFDLASAVEEVLLLLEQSDDGREITVSFERENTAEVRGDPYAVQEVVFHLCTNALAAMPGGGKLNIRVRAADGGAPGFACVEVSDTGHGIPAERLEDIFKPFFTTRAKQGGTGLGLWICNMLISEMGGKMEVESEPGRGSTFRVVLPFADKEGSER